MMSSRLFAVVLSSTALLAFGCSASTTGFTTPTDGSVDSKPGDAGKTDSGKADTGGPVPTDTGSGDQCASKADCTACADYETCATCFEDTDSSGVDALNQIFITGCGCTTGAACATQCATTCSSGTLDTPCVNCLNALTGSEACFDKIRNDCAANSDCARFLTSLQGCPE